MSAGDETRRPWALQRVVAFFFCHKGMCRVFVSSHHVFQGLAKKKESMSFGHTRWNEISVTLGSVRTRFYCTIVLSSQVKKRM